MNYLWTASVALFAGVMLLIDQVFMASNPEPVAVMTASFLMFSSMAWFSASTTKAPDRERIPRSPDLRAIERNDVA